ncbi:MAG: acetyl-CoA carboxylase, carboxyltransferase subunit beta [Alphaproteobacteria bacterium]
MNWITNMVPPKINSWFNKRDTAENLWRKCPNCGDMIFYRDLIANHNVCTSCDFHMRIGPKERLELLFDDGVWEQLPEPDVASDPLTFRDEKRYTDRLKEARTKTGRKDAMVMAVGAIGSHRSVVVVQDFGFMGGSLGMGAGEAFLAAATRAVELAAPFIMVVASGGARMQEGILSLMQMPRTTIGVQMIREAGLPYIVVLTDPTTGGVTASYAMLGDVHIAEPGALVGFTGPRVIEQTIRERLPEGFQRAEYLLDHGMVDLVVHRHDLKGALARVIDLLMVPRRHRGGDEPPLLPVTEESALPAPPIPDAVEAEPVGLSEPGIRDGGSA